MDDTHVDLVLSDIVMPKVDGLTLTRLIGQRFPKLPVVLTTGLTTATTTAWQHGASLLLKPYSVEQLTAAISERLSANQPSTVTLNPDFDLPRVAPQRVQQARAHVAKAEAIVNRQSDILRRLAQTGSDIALATRMLLTFEESLSVMLSHLAREESKTPA